MTGSISNVHQMLQEFAVLITFFFFMAFMAFFVVAVVRMVMVMVFGDVGHTQHELCAGKQISLFMSICELFNLAACSC